MESITWPKVADTVYVEGFAKQSGKKTLSINGVMSYSNTDKRRGGSFVYNRNQISWDIFKKIIVVDGMVKKFDFTSDGLFEVQTKDFLARKEFDINLDERMVRALQIVYLHDRGFLSSSQPTMQVSGQKYGSK